MIRYKKVAGKRQHRPWYIGWKLGFIGRYKVRKHLPDRKVNAIKVVRARTSFQLKESKAYVDAICRR